MNNGSLRMVFKANLEENKLMEVCFTRTPLGLGFTTGQIPMVVTEVKEEGEAWDFGICPGMVIAQINNIEVDSLSYDEALGHLRDGCRSLQLARLKQRHSNLLLHEKQ